MNKVKYNFKENLMVNDSDFIFQKVSNRKLASVYHYHDFYEIILILKGNVKHIVNDLTLNMNVGDCIILTPDDAHCFKLQSDDLELLGISVTVTKFLDLCNAFGINYESFNDVKFFSCINRLNDLKHQSEHCCKTLDDCEKNLITSMILTIYKFSRENKQANVIPALSKAIELMRNDKNLKGGVDALVRLSNYSYPHLYRLMKNHYGVTPHEFVINLKLDTAYNKLTNSDVPIEDIAESVGIHSASHFNKIFTKKYGVSPAKLRKKNNSFF